MIYAEPKLEPIDDRVLDLIREQRTRLRSVAESYPKRWSGSLRRNTFARAIQGSNTIEGYNASIDEAIAAIEEEPPIDERTETWFAINGYRAAMTYIMQAAEDPYFEFSKQFLKSLHFMMTGFDLKAHPGIWRPGPVYVVNRKTGDVVYEAPEVDKVDSLISELIGYLTNDNRRSSVVTAAMAHLNLTMIHPFRDGNGRMARALQTFMLANEGIIHPIFSSIEEWLGKNTEEYYEILGEVGKGHWNPQNDALPWVRFCLKAHYQQANTIIRRFDEYELLFGSVEKLISENKLNERMAIPLFNCALGMRLTNSRYQKDAEVTQHIATRDLRTLSELGLISPHGEKRGRYYVAGDEIKIARDRARRKKITLNPYDLPEVSGDTAPRLPGI